MLIAIVPQEKCRQSVSTPPLTAELEEDLWVASFDEEARVKRKGGPYNAIMWKLPEWKIVSAASRCSTDLTVNEANIMDCCCVLTCWPISEKSG